MAFITLRQLLDHAAKNDYAVPAFNISNLEQLKAVMAAADAVDSPVIIQLSRSARQYASDAIMQSMITAAVEQMPYIPVCLHQDHGDGPATCISAIQHGFTSVMMDGSLGPDGKTPTQFEQNIQITREIVKIAHAVGVSVEGELGHLGSLETGVGAAEDGHGYEGQMTAEQLLTDPDQAAIFVAKTQVDALAIAIGTSHGAYKFSRKPDGDILRMDRLAEIHAAVPDTHLVLHGASCVPRALQDILRDAGGEMAPTWGVPLEEIQNAIRLGVRKVNVDTDLRLAMTGAIRQSLKGDPSCFDPRAYLGRAQTAMQEVCKERFVAFGSGGQAGKLVPKSLKKMAKIYLS